MGIQYGDMLTYGNTVTYGDMLTYGDTLYATQLLAFVERDWCSVRAGVCKRRLVSSRQKKYLPRAAVADLQGFSVEELLQFGVFSGNACLLVPETPIFLFTLALYRILNQMMSRPRFLLRLEGAFTCCCC